MGSDSVCLLYNVLCSLSSLNFTKTRRLTHVCLYLYHLEFTFTLIHVGTYPLTCIIGEYAGNIYTPKVRRIVAILPFTHGPYKVTWKLI
jgi:hypothetical protein